MQVVAIIPARSGSKGLPNKNILELQGKPLIAWSIEFALASTLFSRVIVTTDCAKIASIAIEYGAEVPFLRSPDLSNDTASSSEVILDVIQRCRLDPNHLFVLLEPTSPYRTHDDLHNCLGLLSDSVSKVVSVSEAVSSSAHFQYIRTAPPDCKLSKFDSSLAGNCRRQEISNLYFLDGTFYLSTVKSYMSNPTFLDQSTGSIISNYFSSFEIDSYDDFRLYQAIFSTIGIPFTSPDSL